MVAEIVDLFDSAEVQALKAEIARLEFLNAEERKTIEELSQLCLRAADALDFWMYDVAASLADYEQKAIDHKALVAELREGLCK